MQVQAQISLAIAAAMLLTFLATSSERYGLLLTGFGILLLGLVARAILEGEWRWSRLRTRFFARRSNDTPVEQSEEKTYDHFMHRVFPR